MGLHVEVAGGRDRGLMVGLTGQAGAGKTTLAATWPKPLVLDLEGGSWVLEASGTAVHKTWAQPKGGRLKELLGVLRDVAKTDFATVVVDSWTRLDTWIEKDILEEYGDQSLSQVDGGYGKGQGIHKARTLQVIQALQWLQETRSKHVVWIMHSLVRDENLPSGESFSRYTHEGNKSSVSQVVQACDVVALLRQSITVVGQKGKTAGKARGQGDRELLTGSVPYCDVKSRFHSGSAIIPVEVGACPFTDILNR